MMDDRLDFSIDGVRQSVENLRAGNVQNQKNKQAFLDYIDTKLAPEWNTVEGRVAVQELRNFVNTQFQNYIDYLNNRIDAVEYDVVPALENINRA